MNEFEYLLFAADRNISAIRELKEARETLAFMTGVAVGAIGTLTTVAAVWGIVRIISWL